MSKSLINSGKFRTLVATVAISCYILVSFAQTPDSTAIKDAVSDSTAVAHAAEAQPKAAKAAKPKPDTSSNPLVDYDADVMTNRGDKITRLIGNVHFHHNGAIIQCDSAFQYEDNRMDFFGKVVIQKDSAFVYGDRVNYDGRTNRADVFAPIVKMTQGTATLYSYNLQFDTKTNIGVFYRGGVLSQKGNLMESERGSFDGKSEYVRFLDSVAMRTEDYVIKTDSLGYDFDTERVDFLGRTHIWSNDSSFLMADHGNYFTPTKSYLFTSNSYVMTSDNEVWADTMRYITEGRRAYMFSNVQLLDSANKTVSFGDWGFYDDSLGQALLTLNPSVRSWDKGDTSYMRADTILMLTFEAGKSKLADDDFNQDSISQSVHNSSTTNSGDTTVIRNKAPGDTILRDSTLRDTLLNDSLAGDSTLRDTLSRDIIRDSLPPMAIDSASTMIIDSIPPPLPLIPGTVPMPRPTSDSIPPMEEMQPMLPAADTASTLPPTGETPLTEEPPAPPVEEMQPMPSATDAPPYITADSMSFVEWDEFPYIDRKTRKPAGQLPLWDEIGLGDMIIVADTVIADSFLMNKVEYLKEESIAREQARRDSIKKNEKERVMRAYHRVRMWSKENQAVCDSTVSFSIDSTAVMYGEPVLWNKSNQITAEQIDLYTKNEHLDWADFTGEPFIAQQVIQNDTSKFNQATSKRLETYFTNDELDYAYMSGNVQNIYYMDEEQEVVAMANITCAELTIIFQDREPTKMIWEGQGEGPIFPIEKIPEDEPRYLEGFTWQDSIRPKSAFEICQRRELSSQRAVCELYERPTFPIDEEMERTKKLYLTVGQWSDRVDVPNVTPDYFIERNKQLLF